MPWFDVRFRGYGRNKIVFTAALNASGFAFQASLLCPNQPLLAHHQLRSAPV